VTPAALAEFAKGVGIGAAVAAPVGPMSLLCMRRTLAQGWRFGFGTGAGIAAGDAVYALVAALGLAGVMRFVVSYERPLHAVAGAFLMYLGWRTFFAPAGGAPRREAAAVSTGAAFGSAMLLTLTNPPTIVSFVAIFTALAPAGFDAADALATVGGVFTGSLLWWLLVTAGVSAARHALGESARRWIDRVSGAVLGLLGAAELRADYAVMHPCAFSDEPAERRRA
jgi:threonine/homoserine/homoserine lactone efflux protein